MLFWYASLAGFWHWQEVYAPADPDWYYNSSSSGLIPAVVGGVEYLAAIDVGVTPLTPCPADLTGDGVVDGADLGALLGDWGGSASDLSGDGVVDGADLGALLGAWGACA